MSHKNLFAVALAVILMTVFAMSSLQVATAQGPTGSRTEVEFPAADLSYTTTIPDGSELGITKVITAPTTITVKLTASKPFTYTLVGVSAPAYSTDGKNFSAEVQLADPWDATVAVEGADVEATLVTDAAAKFTVVISKPGPAPSPTAGPTATPSPVVVAAQPIQVYEVQLKKDAPVALTLVVKHGDKIGVNGITTGTVTMTLRSGAPFGIEGGLVNKKGTDGLYTYEEVFDSTNQDYTLGVEETVTGQQVFVSLLSDADTSVKVLYQSAQPVPSATAHPKVPAVGPTAVPGTMPDTGGPDNPTEMSPWDVFSVWIANFLGR